MQKLFIDKIYFFKSLSTSNKPWLDQLKIIAVLFLVERFSFTGTRKEKHLVLKTNTKLQELIKYFFFVFFRLFRLSFPTA